MLRRLLSKRSIFLYETLAIALQESKVYEDITTKRIIKRKKKARKSKTGDSGYEASVGVR
jgi:hypothetical protein